LEFEHSTFPDPLMDLPTTTASVTLRFNEDLASDADFFGLHASVACRGFTGHTQFTIARRDVRRFLDDAANLPSNASDSALLLGGWDHTEERLRLQIARAGLSGQFIARVRIATTGPRADQWNRVETEFIAPPVALSAFMESLAQLVAEQGRPSASLTGDADAVET
jgi:hypothetical protein